MKIFKLQKRKNKVKKQKIKKRRMALDGARGGRKIEDLTHTLAAIDTQQKQQSLRFRGELEQLLDKLPQVVRAALEDAARTGGGEEDEDRLVTLDNLSEIYIQSGRRAEAIFADAKGQKQRRALTAGCCTENDISLFKDAFDGDETIFTTHRKGIAGTLHRLSIIVHPTNMCDGQPRVIGVTARVGRSIHGILEKMAPLLLKSSQSILLIGRPGVGKTTVLREFARMLSANNNLVVVVVDKTNEIGGDGLTPHEAIGSGVSGVRISCIYSHRMPYINSDSLHTSARWMPVGKRGLQADVLREAVENQSPDVVICDEISR